MKQRERKEKRHYIVHLKVSNSERERRKGKKERQLNKMWKQERKTETEKEGMMER